MGRIDAESETLIPTHGGRFDVAGAIYKDSFSGGAGGRPERAAGNHFIAIPGNVINRKPENGGNGVGADESDVMYTLTKTDQHAIAFGWQNSAQQGASASASHTPTLDKSKVPAVMAMHETGQGFWQSGDVSGTLRAEGENRPSRPSNVVSQSMQVRRLTPTECERLQGFPDGYTQVPYRNKPAADGPRYKALGNSMAVPVMRWIGERIKQVDKL